ncbi:MAG: signal recognition particle-docking protein FtsY [Acidimicrobiales bacterium]
MELLILVIVLAVVLGVSAGLVVARRRNRPALEPPPDAPKVTEAIRKDVEEREQAFLERLEQEEAAASAGGEETGAAAPAADASASGDAAAPSASTSAPEGDEAASATGSVAAAAAEAPAEAEPAVKPRFRDRLAKARDKLKGTFGALRKAKIDDDAWEELEYALIGADVGIEPTQELLEHLKGRVAEEGLTDGEQLLEALKDEMKQRLGGFDLELHYAEQAPSVWLFVGVNGVGKTTTIGKVGKREALEGKQVVMAAGDTFRAAAAEQLETWAERAGADLVRGNEGGDPSAVIFDAIESAAAKGADLVLADTAGRLHTKVNLMEELRKVRRVADKGDGTVSEVLLVLDATTGQNGLRQAEQFTEAVDLTGVVLTKLDGSAKGGIIFAIQSQLGIPVKLVGLGETADDLVPFDADEFVDALFAE